MNLCLLASKSTHKLEADSESSNSLKRLGSVILPSFNLNNVTPKLVSNNISIFTMARP